MRQTYLTVALAVAGLTGCGGRSPVPVADEAPEDVPYDQGQPDPGSESGQEDAGGGEEVPQDFGLDALDAAEPDISLPPLDLSERLAPGEVRAGRVEKAADLIGGRTAKGRIGDFKIYNSRVAFILHDAGRASGYKYYGGNLADADVVRPEGEPGQSQLGELFFGFAFRVFEPLEARILCDGRGCSPAKIRFQGRDAVFKWLASFAGEIMGKESLGCMIAYEYSLGPDDEYLTLDITVENAGEDALELPMMGAFVMGDGLDTHFPGPGFDTAWHHGEFPYWAALGDALSYGLLAAEGPIDMGFNTLNVAFGFYPALHVPPGGSATVRRYFAVVGGGLDQVARVFRGLEPGAKTGTLSGTIEAQEEAFRRGIRIHVLSPDKDHLSVVVPDHDTGRFAAEMEPGTYILVAKADGFDPSAEVLATVTAGEETEVSLVLPPSTPFEYRVTSQGGQLVPARLTFLRQDGPPTNILPAKFGEETYPLGAALVLFAGTGEGSGVLPRGTYDVIVTRGTEYERDSTVIVAAESPLSLSFHLEHVVDSSGWLSSDGHLHAEHSPDTSISEKDRVLTALADGLEVPILTEHDVTYGLDAATATIPGASKWVQFIVGSEVTTYVYGHFNAFPLTPRPHLPNHGGIEWFDTWAPDLFQAIRASEPHPVVIQVNHPRGASIGAYFSAVGLDRETGTIAQWSNWSEDFEAIEVFNGGCSNGDTEPLLDWFDFLNRGYRVSVSGGSDTHSEHGIGFPRVYVPTPHSPAEFDPQEIVQAYRGQRVFVSCGPFVRFEVGGIEPGGLLTEPGPLSAFVEIQAPSWMSLLDFRIIRNGSVVFSLPASDWTPQEGAVRFSDFIDLPPSESDAWYVLEVRGQGDVWPLYGGSPYAITNPVYVDADASGAFEAPWPRYQPADGS